MKLEFLLRCVIDKEGIFTRKCSTCMYLRIRNGRFLCLKTNSLDVEQKEITFCEQYQYIRTYKRL